MAFNSHMFDHSAPGCKLFCLEETNKALTLAELTPIWWPSSVNSKIRIRCLRRLRCLL
jgi:hypothetical protein